MKTNLRKLLATIVGALNLVSIGWGYSLLTNDSGQAVTWPAGTVSMQIMVDNAVVLSDGNTRAACIQAAMQLWNATIESVQFSPHIAAVGTGVDHNAVNEIFFSDSAYGYAWDSNTLAITTGWYSGTQRTEADVVFNTAFTWDSYRGPLRVNGGAIDIQRVALHELGHVLGLEHPDEHGQVVPAVMNSVISYIDSLQPDDIAGAQSLYGIPQSGPSVVSQPSNQTVYVGQNAQFNVTFAGYPNPSYRWQRLPAGTSTWTDLNDGGIYSGTTTGTLTISNPTVFFSGDQLRCIATNSLGNATSAPATLMVLASVFPSITGQPSTQTILEGNPVTFAATATGVPAPTFQWQKDGINIAGATSSSYSISRVSAGDAGSYAVVVSNLAGTVTSSVAILTVNSPPLLTNLSAARIVLHPGQSLSLAVKATGSGPLSFKWTHNGRVVSGATSNTLSIGAVNLSDGGYYLVDVTDIFGTRRSAPMFVIVTPTATQVLTWGSNPPVIPANTDHAVAIAPGLILNADGTVVGLNDYAQAPVPAGLTDIVAISSGGFALALKSDGTVTGWGYPFDDTLVPLGLNGVVAISVGGHHALALKSDGTVVAWGEAQYGATAVPVGLKDVIAIAAGTDHSLALKSDGTVVAWGENSSGQTNVPDGLVNVMSVAAGYSHSLALKVDGTATAWGSNTSQESSNFSGLTNLAAVYAGYYYSLAIKNDGTVIGFGGNAFNQIPVPSGLNNIIALPSGSSSPLALRDSSRDLAPTVTVQPVSVSRVEGAEAVFGVVASSGTGSMTYQWRRNGINIAGATGSSIEIAHVSPADAGQYDVVVSSYLGSTVSNAVRLNVSRVAAITSGSPKRQVLIPGQALNLMVTASGTGTLTYQWMHNGRPINAATGASFSIPSLTMRDGGYYFVDIKDAVGVRRSAAFFVKVAPANTQIVAWGMDFQHETEVPVTLKRPIAVAAGGYISLALEADGSVASWGYPLGKPPEALSGVVALDAGEHDALALKSDGTVVAWGFDPSAVPDGLDNVVAIAAGATSLALKADGTVVAWGQNDEGQVAFAAGLSGVVDVAANNTRLLALRADGTVVEWGNINSNGVAPVAIPNNLSNVVALSTAWSNYAALKMDGSVVVWGYTDSNEIDVPAGLNNVIAISIGGYEALALKTDGTLASWGGNAVFQKNSLAAGLTGVAAIAVSEMHSLALCESTGGYVRPEMTSQPVSAVVVLGGTATFTGSAGGAPAPTYQWQKNGVNLSDGGDITGATAPVLNLTDVKITDEAVYTLVATNSEGSVTSEAVNLTLQALPLSPNFTTQPTDQAAKIGSQVMFSAVATGSPVLNYQWRKNGLNIAGATGRTFSINNVSGDDAGDYSVVVFNTVDSVVSESGHLSIDTSSSAPAFILQPASLTIGTGYSIAFSGLATGSPTPTYQWKKNGQNIVGATDNAYLISKVSAGDAGSYSVVVANSAGSITSNVAVLTVVPPVAGASATTIDMDGDGQSDLFWQNTVTGERSFWLMNGTAFKVGVSLGMFAPDWTIVGSGDFNHDGQTDLLWQNTITGERTIWLMNGTSFSLGVDLGTYSTDIRIMASGDFNDDGQTDIVVEDTITGEATIWLMNGTAKTSEVSLGVRPTSWSIAGTGDFNGDGKVDLIWQNAATGERAVWLMNGTAMSSNVPLGIVGKQFQIVGTGDYNRDGKTDLVWTDTATGDRTIWLMDGLVHSATITLSHVSPEWSLDRPIFLIAQTAHADFNGDGQTDIVVQNHTSGERTISFMSGASITSAASLITTSTDWVIAGTGDFNQDDKPDLVWSNTVTGERTIWLMDGITKLSNVPLTTLSPTWVISAIGDFNYDGKPDIVWTNTATGERAVWLMNGTVFGSGVSVGTVSTAWKIATTADLNGDGKTDLIWQNTVTGENSVWLMNGGSFAAGVVLDALSPQWSIVGTGDFNADGKADLLLQNTATGERVVRLMNRTALLSTVTLGTDATDRVIGN